MSSKVTGALMVFFAAFLWSLIGVIFKTANANLIWIIFIRCLPSGIILAPFLLRNPVKPFKMVLIAGLFYGAMGICFGITTRTGNAGMAVSMQYAAPVYVLAYSFIRNKRVSRPQAITFVLLLIGVVCVLFSAVRTAPAVAILTGFITSMSFIFYSYYMKKISEGSPFGIVAVVNLVAAGCCLPLLPFHYLPVPSRATVWGILISGILISAISYILYRIGLQRISLESAMIISLTELLLNPVWIFLATKERPSNLVCIGLFFVFIGAIADALGKKRMGEQLPGS